MNGFLRRLLNYDLVLYLAEDRRQKRAEIERLRCESVQMQLEYARNVRDLIAHFRSALEMEDLDTLEETLAQGLQDMNDSVARLEEHA